VLGSCLGEVVGWYVRALLGVPVLNGSSAFIVDCDSLYRDCNTIRHDRFLLLLLLFLYCCEGRVRERREGGEKCYEVLIIRKVMKEITRERRAQKKKRTKGGKWGKNKDYDCSAGCPMNNR